MTKPDNKPAENDDTQEPGGGEDLLWQSPGAQSLLEKSDDDMIARMEERKRKIKSQPSR